MKASFAGAPTTPLSRMRPTVFSIAETTSAAYFRACEAMPLSCQPTSLARTSKKAGS
jgi:hypothetical protein